MRNISKEQLEVYFGSVKDSVSKCHTALLRCKKGEDRFKIRQSIKGTLIQEIHEITDNLLNDSGLGTRKAFESTELDRKAVVAGFKSDQEKVGEEASKALVQFFDNLNKVSQSFKKLDNKIDKIFDSLEKHIEDTGKGVFSKQLSAFTIGLLTAMTGVVLLFVKTNIYGPGPGGRGEMPTPELIAMSVIATGLMISAVAGTYNMGVATHSRFYGLKPKARDPLSKFSEFYKSNAAMLTQALQEFEQSLPEEIQEKYKKESQEQRETDTNKSFARV